MTRAKPRAPTSRDRIWQAIQASPERFSRRSLMEACPGVRYAEVNSFLKLCLAAGAVEDAGTARVPSRRNQTANMYRCPEPRRRVPGTHEHPVTHHGKRMRNIWNSMRALKEFTVTELTVTASQPELEVKRSRVQAYVTALLRHGVLRCTRPGGGWRAPVYSLTRSGNTGPQPPRVRSDRKAIFDGNRRRWISSIETAEVPA